MTAYIYPIALALISVFVMALEHFFPKRPQQQLRKMFWSDLIHLVFNGHFLGVIIFGLSTYYILPYIDTWLRSAGMFDAVYRNAASTWPIWLQIIVAMVVIDFVQWCVHNLLHRVPFLWEFHKTHHSVKNGEMDWIVSFRFQWTEVMVYKAIQYLPLAWFGFHPYAVLTHAVFGTLIGHLNHANLDWDWGPLKYVFNSPNMHIWHHDYEGDTHSTVNFGIIFSTWDWIFGTAKMPDHDPPNIGFHGVEEFPETFFEQALWPVQRWLPVLRKSHVVAGILGALLVLAGYGLAVAPKFTSGGTKTPMFGETAAASQPSGDVDVDPAAYAETPEAATANLARFGEQAKADGLEHPEYMVSVAEVAAALGSPKLVLLDVRPMDRFEAGHIPTAHQLYRPDYSVKVAGASGVSRSADELQAMLRSRGVSKDSVVVAYTDGGPEAYRLWWTLRDITGYEIRVLDGGLQQWKAEGHGIAGGRGLDPEPGDIELSGEEQKPRMWADIKQFMAERDGAVMLDTRSVPEFDGTEQNKKAARAGRIPGSRHVEWYAPFRDQGDDGEGADYRLMTRDDLETFFTKLGVEPGAPVVTYCQSGTRSSAVYFALVQRGHDPADIVNYDGSWAEYSRLDLPIEP